MLGGPTRSDVEFGRLAPFLIVRQIKRGDHRRTATSGALGRKAYEAIMTPVHLSQKKLVREADAAVFLILA